MDVERNLRAPLIGITQTAARLGLDAPAVSVGVRSGDTPTNERRRLLSHPPDILITTPESLYLMLTSKARETLTAVHTIIIDEVHAVAGTKRGAHLAVSLERLDALLETPAQRIGLSATVEPHSTVARFLGGQAPVSIVAPASTKTWNLGVTVPVADMTELPALAAAHDLGPASGLQPNASIWPHVEEKIVDAVLAKKSTIIFANSRRLAERLTGRLNEIYLERLELAELAESASSSLTDDAAGPTPARDPGRAGEAGELVGIDGAASSSDPWRTPASPAHSPARLPAEMMAQAGAMAGAPNVLAKAHHGSVSKEQRALIEDDLKSGRLRAVVATSSLELGIDMGAVDLVIQVESPPSVASGLQRVGRAGHQVGEISEGLLFPKHRADLLHSAVTVERMLAGQIEPLSIPANPLDILAQQTVAATALESIGVDEWFETVRRSAPLLPSRGQPSMPRWTCWPDATPLMNLPSCVRALSGTARLAPSRAAPEPSGWPSLPAGPSRTAASLVSSLLVQTSRAQPELPTRAAGAWANSMRRWSTSPGWAMSLPLAPQAGRSRTSPLTACWSPRLRSTRQAAVLEGRFARPPG